MSRVHKLLACKTYKSHVVFLLFSLPLTVGIHLTLPELLRSPRRLQRQFLWLTFL